MSQSHSQVDLDTRRTSHRDLAPGSSSHNTSVVLCSVLECSAVRVGLSTELQTFMERAGLVTTAAQHLWVLLSTNRGGGTSTLGEWKFVSVLC